LNIKGVAPASVPRVFRSTRAHSSVYLFTHSVCQCRPILTKTGICYQIAAKLPEVLGLLQADICSLNSLRQHRSRR